MAINEFIRLNVILPLAERVQGTCATKWYKQINKMSTWSSDEIKKWQETELQKFIKHAYNHTVYYKRTFDELGIDPSEIKTPEDLKKIPVITKDIIRSHYYELIPDDLHKFKHRISVTGGTTGKPMRYLCDENTWGYVTAAKIYYWKKTGYKYGDPFAALGSASILSLKPSFKRMIYDKIRNEIGINSMGIDNNICENYINVIRKKHIHYIYGYASSIYVFAKYIIDSNIEINKIKAVFTTSENLTEHYREVIEKAFNCIVMDCYGAKDAGITAYEAFRGQYNVGYNVIAEDVNGVLLSTNFINNSFPLIRYDFGDSATLSTSPTQYNGQTITHIAGRISDMISLDNGRTLTAPGFTILMPKFDIKAFRIKQTSGSDLLVQIQPIIDKFDDSQEVILLNEMKRLAGEGCNVKIEHVAKFESLPNGKNNFFFNS